MNSRVIRAAVLSAAITTVLVTAITLFAIPKVPAPPLGDQVLRASAPQPAVPEPAKPSAGRVVLPADVRDNSVEVGSEVPGSVPTVRRHRSTADSIAIVAGSAGAGAAIGGAAKGGKGAAIGALAGGVAGLLYDRLTADQQPQPQTRTVQQRK